MNDAPSQSQDKFIVRLPNGMRDRIKVAAEANNRSMNAEIISRLEKSFDAGEWDDQDIGALASLMKDVLIKLASKKP